VGASVTNIRSRINGPFIFPRDIVKERPEIRPGICPTLQARGQNPQKPTEVWPLGAGFFQFRHAFVRARLGFFVRGTTEWSVSNIDNASCIIRKMLNCGSLRIDADDGSSAIDYRIQDGCVETRILTAENPAVCTWRRLTPEQLTSLVTRDTVVAYWLRRRLGLHRLIRACSPMLPAA